MANDNEGRLSYFGQAHIEAYLKVLTGSEQRRLLDDVSQIDLPRIAELYGAYRASQRQGNDKKIFEAAEVLQLPRTNMFAAERSRLKSLGEDMLGQGRIAIFLVAGGQGTRLGYNGPKGCFPVSPAKQKSLFQLFSENILALRRRYGTALPWYIMT